MGTRADQGSWLVEQDGSPFGTFDMIATCPTPARGLSHYLYDLRLPFTAVGSWTKGDRIRKAGFYGPFTGASLVLNSNSDFEIVAAQNDGSLAHLQRSTVHGWRGPTFLPGRVAGPPAFIRSRFGRKGNYEVVAPTPGGGLSHFWRDNDGGEVWREAPRPTSAGTWSGLGLIHSSFGNLEIVGVRDGRLVFLWQGGAGGQWSAPVEILPALWVVGRPAFIQSGRGTVGNFEVIVARAEGLLAHLWRNNDIANFPWIQASVFGTDRQRRTRTFDDVTAIQSSFDRLEVVARLAGRGIIEHFREYCGAAWEGPSQAVILEREQEQTGGLTYMG